MNFLCLFSCLRITVVLCIVLMIHHHCDVDDNKVIMIFPLQSFDSNLHW